MHDVCWRPNDTTRESWHEQFLQTAAPPPLHVQIGPKAWHTLGSSFPTLHAIHRSTRHAPTKNAKSQMCLSRPRLCCKAARAKNGLQVQRIAWCLQGSLFVYPEASEVVYQQRELLTQNQHLWSAAGRGCVRCHDSENNRLSLVRVSGRHSCMWSVSFMFTVKENVSRPLQPFFLPSISTAGVLPPTTGTGTGTGVPGPVPVPAPVTGKQPD